MGKLTMDRRPLLIDMKLVLLPNIVRRMLVKCEFPLSSFGTI